MCGITGLISGYQSGMTQNEWGLLQQNMVVNILRGADSTGMFYTPVKVVGVNSVKSTGSPMALWANERWNAFRTDMVREAMAVITHGRSATRGSVKTENAHPFTVPYDDAPEHNITLVHNGTLDAWQNLPGFRDFEVDSHWIAHAIQKHGADEALSKIRGAMAIVWVDTKSKTLNFYRNADRPLSFVEVAGPNKASTMLINSEQAALRWLMDRNKLEFFEKKGEITSFQPCVHYSLPLPELGGDFKTTKVVAKSEVFAGYSFPGRDVERDKEMAEKNLLIDARAIAAGKITEVKWEYNTRTTTLADGTVTIQQYPPYRTWLNKMIPHEDDPEKVRLMYKSFSGSEWWEEIKVPPATPLLPAPAGTKADVNGDFEWAGTKYINPAKLSKFRAGRRVTWHSRTHKDTVNHRATIREGVFLKDYKNTVDGEFTVGQKINLEVVDVIERVNKRNQIMTYTVICSQLVPTGKMSQFIEFYWNVDDITEVDKVLDNGYYEGEIEELHFATTESYDSRGNHVLARIGNAVGVAIDQSQGILCES